MDGKNSSRAQHFGSDIFPRSQKLVGPGVVAINVDLSIENGNAYWLKRRTTALRMGGIPVRMDQHQRDSLRKVYATKLGIIAKRLISSELFKTS